MSGIDPNERMHSLLWANLISKSIWCAAELEIADRLKDGPRSAEELAIASDCSVEHLDRLLSALSTIGIFRRSDDKFENTALSSTLIRGDSSSCWCMASFYGNEVYKATDHLLTTLRTGRDSWREAHGVSVWDYFERNPDRGSVFDRVMNSSAVSESRAVLETYDFSSCRTVVDVGGGNGDLLMAVLERFPAARGVLYDKPKVVARARAEQRDRSPYVRCDFVAGDFFTSVPAGGDVYLLRRILHDWDDDSAVKILRTCRSALVAKSRVLLVEAVLNRQMAGNWLDVGMMIFGGKERTADDYERLLRSAELRLQRVLSTGTRVSIIEAEPS